MSGVQHVNKLIWHDVILTHEQKAFFKQQVSIRMRYEKLIMHSSIFMLVALF